MENFSLENGILTINSGTLLIPEETFAERHDIEKVILPKSVRVIGGAAFSFCDALRSVVFPEGNGLQVIGSGAFIMCSSLGNFDFHHGLREIGEMAFWETSLTSVTLPESVESVGYSAFWGCHSLLEFNVPGPSCRLDRDVIGSCESLRQGYIAPGYPESTDYYQPDELAYSLLWLSCPERHTQKTGERARSFIRSQEMVVMEMILEHNNTAAMSGLVKEGLLTGSSIDRYMAEAEKRNLVEIMSLLLETKRSTFGSTGLEEFEL